MTEDYKALFENAKAWAVELNRQVHEEHKLRQQADDDVRILLIELRRLIQAYQGEWEEKDLKGAIELASNVASKFDYM